MSLESHFSIFENPRHVWAVSAIHGETDRLCAVHEMIGQKFTPGDRIVYLGNYSGGSGHRTVNTINELLGFRRSVMAIPGVKSDDIVYLRGTHEEMWHKILQIQFAPSPAAVIEWMVNKGVEGALSAYGSTAAEALRAAREGIMSMTRWTSRLREGVRLIPGHEKFFTVLRRAAISEDKNSGHNLLFVHAGVDPSRPLAAQGDSFWWGGRDFDKMDTPYAPFTCVIRGYDPERGGLRINATTISLDDGSGYGGDLVAAKIAANGEVIELLRA